MNAEGVLRIEKMRDKPVAAGAAVNEQYPVPRAYQGIADLPIERLIALLLLEARRAELDCFWGGHKSA
jgi:hypothetical protein